MLEMKTFQMRTFSTRGGADLRTSPLPGCWDEAEPQAVPPRCSPRPQRHHQVPGRAPGVPKPEPSGARRRTDRLRCRPWVQFAGLCPLARDDSKAPWDLGKGHGEAQRPRRVRPPCLSAEGAASPLPGFGEPKVPGERWRRGDGGRRQPQGHGVPLKTHAGPQLVTPPHPTQGRSQPPRASRRASFTQQGRGNTSLFRSH